MPQPPATPPAGDPPADPAADPAPATPPEPTGNVPPTLGDPPTEAPEGWTPPTYAEVQAQQRAIAAANQRARKLESDQQAAADALAAEQGQFKDIAEREQQRAANLESGIKTSAVRAAIIETAQRLQFRNPTLAPKLIATDGLDAVLGDDFTASVEGTALQTIEARLKAALEGDPYLKGEAPRAQLAGAGDPAAGAQGGGNAAMNALLRQGAGRGTVE